MTAGAVLAGVPVLGHAETEQAEPVVARSPVVVELYTSQGCSSCPAADRMLEQMVGHPEVLPLALHVDYWDYLGWKDGLADPQFTRRQKAYARSQGSRMIYTPQMVVNGQGFVKGAHAVEVAEQIAMARMRTEKVRLQVEKRPAGGYMVRAEALPGLPEGTTMQVMLVQYLPHKEIEILRGENAGTRIDYVNIVTSWTPVGEWDGTAPLAMELEVPLDQPGAVLLQRTGMGPIEAAARLP